MSKYLKWQSCGPMRGDCTCEWRCSLIGNPTVKELCDDIISNDREWGYIGIAKKGTIFGEPNIEFADGQYVDGRRKKIDFNFPEEIANKKVINVTADGGWSRMDYLLYLEEKERKIMERNEREIKPLINEPTKGEFNKSEKFIKVYDGNAQICYYIRAKEIKSIGVFDNELKAILYESNDVVVIINPKEIEPLLNEQEFGLIMEELKGKKNHG